ncbi:response regulator [Microbacterium radiodurans]|uniref:response regulator n=1 Tax=Microbacterium radiodurans TaxID=661398 RepID=UPI001CC4FEFD|nr:response regulator [Microbacterium radiodurans]
MSVAGGVRAGSDGAPAARIRTLVVDDDEAAGRLHAGYVAALEAFTVVARVGTGAAAARLVAAGEVDLLLLDMNLPDFSGVEVLRRLRATSGTQVDVLVISSARDPLTVRQALAGHVVGYLVKPFTKEALLARLADYAAGAAERVAETAVPLGQGEIDGLLRGAAPTGTTAVVAADAPLPKGIASSTLTSVRDALDHREARSVQDVAARSGASRPTARRYLDHLVRTGEVDVSHRFGGRGRPEVLYRLAPG